MSESITPTNLPFSIQKVSECCRNENELLHIASLLKAAFDSGQCIKHDVIQRRCHLNFTAAIRIIENLYINGIIDRHGPKRSMQYKVTKSA